MPRRRSPEKRKVLPDPKYKDVILAKFMNNLMKDGKKSVAEKIVYGAFDQITKTSKEEPLEVFMKALDEVSPVVEVKSRRVGGANYQVPIEIRPARRQALAMRWIVEAARKRSEKSMNQAPAKLTGMPRITQKATLRLRNIPNTRATRKPPISRFSDIMVRRPSK